MLLRVGYIATIISCSALLSPAGAADWTRFRGPNGRGISQATTIPIQWTDEDYNWKVKLPGQGHSSPVVLGQRIYLTCADPAGTERGVICLHRDDGRTLWYRRFAAEKYRQHRDNGYATATPSVDADGVVVTWTTPEQIVLLAFDHEGNEIWRRNLGPFVGPHGTGTSPIIVDGLVILANEQEDFSMLYRLMGRPNESGPAGESFVIAVDRQSGETRWKTPRRSTLAPYSTPCVRRPENEPSELILSSTSHGISALDVATGKLRWQLEGIFDDRCVASPIVASGMVLASYGAGVSGRLLVAARPANLEQNGKPSIVFQVKHSVPLVPTPLAYNDRLFLWSDAGIVSCLRLSDGTVIWRKRLPGDFFGSPVCVDGRLYCIAKNGDVFVLAASDDFQQLARIPLGEPSFATPAIANGVMYLRTESHLYSLGNPGHNEVGNP